MADDKKGFFGASYDFFKAHWGEILTIGHIFGGAIKGKAADGAPDTAKAVVGAIAPDTGGPNSFKDEDVYEAIMAELSPKQRRFLLRWTAFEFPTSDSDPWLRKQARSAHEVWRQYILYKVSDPKVGAKKIKIVTKRDDKGKPTETEDREESYVISPGDDTKAVAYLQQIADDIINEIQTVAREKKLSKTTVEDMSKRQLKSCEPEAFLRITHMMQQMGATWMPEPDEKPFASRMRDLFNGIGPASSQATTFAREKILPAAKKWWRFSRKTGKRFAKRGWEETKETAAAHTKWMEQHATKRNRQDANLSWFDRFLNAILPF